GAAFLLAAAVGWFNGWMVNRTGLPSFIVTLGTFFAVRGMIVVMAQRLVGKVQVDSILKQRGAEGFKNWIAHEWQFKEFSGRDPLFLGLVIGGGAAFLYGLLDQSFIRRVVLNGKAALVTALGAVATVVGFTGLLKTDGVSNNLVYGIIGCAGLITVMVALGLTRWQARSDRGEATTGMPRSVATNVGLGAAGIVLACVTHIPFDRHQRLPVLTWTSDSLRPIIAVLCALARVSLAYRAMLPALRGNWKAFGIVKLVLLS